MRSRAPGAGLISLVGLAVVLQPSSHMAADRVVVGPVDDAALSVPLVDAMEGDGVAGGELIQTRRKIDVVGHEQGLSTGQFDQESLVATALVVVFEQLEYRAFAAHLHATALFGNGAAKGTLLVAAAGGWRAWVGRETRAEAEVECRRNGDGQKEFVHRVFIRPNGTGKRCEAEKKKPPRRVVFEEAGWPSVLRPMFSCR